MLERGILTIPKARAFHAEAMRTQRMVADRGWSGASNSEHMITDLAVLKELGAPAPLEKLRVRRLMYLSRVLRFAPKILKALLQQCDRLKLDGSCASKRTFVRYRTCLVVCLRVFPTLLMFLVLGVISSAVTLFSGLGF